MNVDTTFDIAGRPYSPRDLTIREMQELWEMHESGDADTAVAALGRQVAFLLVGPDGEHPDPDAVLDHVSYRDAMRLLADSVNPEELDL